MALSKFSGTTSGRYLFETGKENWNNILLVTVELGA